MGEPALLQATCRGGAAACEETAVSLTITLTLTLTLTVARTLTPRTAYGSTGTGSGG